jgi:hypothetical protein
MYPATHSYLRRETLNNQKQKRLSHKKPSLKICTVAQEKKSFYGVTFKLDHF